MDTRILKVEFDHPQRRVKRGRITMTVDGMDFLDGDLNYCFVNPTTGILQPMPNSEHPDFATSNVGAFRKLQLSDVTTINQNPATPSVGEFKMMAAEGMHADSAIRYVGENTAGVGVLTTAVQPENQGYTCLVYSYGKSTSTNGALVTMFWGNDSSLSGGGVSVVVKHQGAVEIYRNGSAEENRVFKGTLSGGGYQPGTVRGASYERVSDTYVMVRVEVTQGRFITITSSKGGTCSFAAPWATGDDPQPVLPAKKWGWFQLTGGGCVVSAPVVYATGGPYAISPVVQLSEAPGAGQQLHIRTIPSTTKVALSLVGEDGVSAYDPDQRLCRIKAVFNDNWFVRQVTGYYPPITAMTPDGTVDVSDYVLSCPLSFQDSADGAETDLVLRGDAPVPLLTEAEGRPIRVSLVPRGDDTTGSPSIVWLDGIGGAPVTTDGRTPELRRVTIKVKDRLSLLKDAYITEPTPFDGLPICRPYAPGEGAPFYGDSIARICGLEAGFIDSEMELADLGFKYEETASPRSSKANFTTALGDRYGELLDRAMGSVPEAVCGVRPRPLGARFFVREPKPSDEVLSTFYRDPDDAEGDDAYFDNELQGYPWLYGEHERTRLPREGNLVRVTGYDPAADKGIQSYISDDASRDPASPLTESKLGFTRTIAYGDPALTTQAMVDRVTEGLYRITAQKATAHKWRGFVRFLGDGSPVWRGDMIRLKGANPSTGGDVDIHVSALQCDPDDESGEGLMDSSGVKSPVSIRMGDYCGGALVGLGGSSLEAIRARGADQISLGEIRRRGFGMIPAASMAVVKRLTPPS